MSENPVRILSALMVLVAQSQDKAMLVADLAVKLGMGMGEVEAELTRLVDAKYVVILEEDGVKRVYLTGTGIITASSAYS